MSVDASQWMPIYISDYLGDTQRLTTEQHGAYFLLLMDYWRNGRPPADDAVLASITKLALPAWKKAKPLIMAFFSVERGHLVHKRVESELKKAATNVEQRRAAGVASAQARQRKRNGDGNESGNENPTTVGTNVEKPMAKKGNDTPNENPDPHLSPVVTKPLPSRTAPALPGDVRQVMEEGGFVSPPPDTGLLAEWYAAGATLDQDILPTVRRVRPQLAKAPFKLRVFDAAIREKLAADEAEIEHLRRVARRNGAPAEQPQEQRP